MNGFRIKIFRARTIINNLRGKDTPKINEGWRTTTAGGIIQSKTNEARHTFPTRDLRSYKEALLGGVVNLLGEFPRKSIVDIQEQQSQTDITKVWVIDKDKAIQCDDEGGGRNLFPFRLRKWSGEVIVWWDK
ncbi:hypothetical protein V6N13_006027 [Hibiscus sabdariffa]|uniref:Uncharacterized protein n=1 Tax=Hibiscus sabdariffa TaxID=183260 RepID=A0ABR2EP02_9ROSI